MTMCNLENNLSSTTTGENWNLHINKNGSGSMEPLGMIANAWFLLNIKVLGRWGTRLACQAKTSAEFQISKYYVYKYRTNKYIVLPFCTGSDTVTYLT